MAAPSLGFRSPYAGLLALLLLPDIASGQAAATAPAWTLQTDQAIEWLRFLPSHLLVVSSDDGLRGVDPADGSVRWRRDDLKNASQVSFDAAQQTAPLPGAAPAATTSTAAPVIRLMEELPGGRLAAILADSVGKHTWFDVIELETGRTVWSSKILSLGEARGFLPFPDSSTILVYGPLIEPGRNRRFWARVEAATGKLLWSTDSLLLQSPAQFDSRAMAASRGTVNGNQPLVALADSTMLLFASPDGLVRFESGSGRVRWRSPVANGEVGPIGQGYSPMVLSGDTAYLPAGRTIDAFDVSTGRRLWSAGPFATITTQAAATSGGLLIRGQPLLLAGENPQAQPPFSALLDTRTGKARWRREFDRGSGLTPFLVNGDTALIASDKGLLRLSLATGKDSALTTGKLAGRPAASLEMRDDGILLGAAQSLTLLGPDGSPRFQREFPAPSLGLGGRLLRIALGAAAIAGGAYYSGGYLTGSAFAKYQFSTSRYASNYVYFVLKDHEGQGPALAKIDKRSGEIAAVVGLNHDKTPEYAIDAYSGLLVIKGDKSLVGYRW